MNYELVQRLETLTALVKQVEAGIGRPSKGFKKVVRPILWDAVASLAGDLNTFGIDFESTKLKVNMIINSGVKGRVDKISMLLGSAAQA